MDKRDLPLIIVLIIAIIAFYPALNYFGIIEDSEPTTADSTAVEQPVEQLGQTTPVQTATGQATSQPATTVAGDTTSLPTEMAEMAAPDSMLAPPETLLVRTNTYEVMMTTDGGGPVSLILTEYTHRDGRPIDMLALAEQPTPDAVFAGGTFSTSGLRYTCSHTPGEYEARSSTLEIDYSFTAPSGGTITRRFRFHPDSYHFDFELLIDAPAQLGFERNYNVAWNTPLNPTEPQWEQDYEAFEAVAMMSGSRESLDDWDEGRLRQTLEGYTSWAGVRQKYFAAVIIPRGDRETEAVFAEGTEREIRTPEGTIDQRQITAGLKLPFTSMNPIADSFAVFVGPLDYTIMSDYDVDLEEMLGIGTTPVVGWIIKPFALGVIWLLPRMYDFVPNYGVVIIFFALLVKLITLPLSMKTFKSMQAMRELGPQLEKLKEQYKKDPQALNRETMKMYKKAGVNPMSGCLPMLPQMPLFIAMFSVFRATILLRDAPFIWPITDLSHGATGLTDPYIILVVIMVVAQFLSQKLTMPSTGQNKMLAYAMPLLFGFLFYQFAAGLVLYWVCFSLFSMLDYVLFKRKKNPQVKAA